MESSLGRCLVRVLVASSDQVLVQDLQAVLSSAGYAPRCVEISALSPIVSVFYAAAAAIIDVGPDDQSFAWGVLQYLSKVFCTPCLVITAADRPDLKLKALRVGASAVLARPVNPRELVLRLDALLGDRKASSPVHPIHIINPTLAIDAEHGLIAHGDHIIALTPHEHVIMKLLLHSRNRVVHHNEMCVSLGLSCDNEGLNALRETVSRLRRKLKGRNGTIQLIAERGIGYRLNIT